MVTPTEPGTLGGRLEFALKLRGKSQTWLAEQVEVSENAVTKWKATGKISRENAQKVAKTLQLDLHWFLEGDGTPPSNEERQPRPPYGALRIPVVGTAQLGDDGFWADLDYPVGHGDGQIRLRSNDANTYAVRCRGDSMKPRIKSGEFVVVEPNRTPQPGDDVLVKDKKGRVMVKEWIYTRDEQLHLMSINETHSKITIPLADVEVMHFVAGIVNESLWERD